jgi:hypothetical protein
MKKAFAALLLVSAIIVGFTMHAAQTATITFPDPTAIVKLM